MSGSGSSAGSMRPDGSSRSTAPMSR
jgi:hypothetical protein